MKKLNIKYKLAFNEKLVYYLMIEKIMFKILIKFKIFIKYNRKK